MISKKKERIIFLFLLLFAMYCAIVVGQSWDGNFHLLQGKITLEYLFSLGKIDKELFYREFYSPIYWSIQYLLTLIFPIKYQIEVSHIVNLIFSIGTIFGLSKIGKELFNKDVGKIIFLILFLYPIFFGHMGFNSKDTILAFSHIWITYLTIRYLKNHNLNYKTKKWIFLIAFLAAVGTGIQLVFLGSLLPLIILVILDIFFIKKLTKKKFLFKIFILDLLKCFLIFYLCLIIFWIDSHPNILILPFKFFTDTLSETYWTGWAFNLLNGNYYFSDQVPKSYLIVNFLFKTPEYILFLYLVFFVILIKSKSFFTKKFKNFNTNILFIVSILVYPNLILFIVPYPIYDGMRLFLWMVPYFCIIPAISIYFLIKNYKSLLSKLIIFSLIIMFVHFIYIFISITPYQYTYLNLFNGKNEYRYKKFENDYWGISISELIKNSNLNKKIKISMSTCGINDSLAKNYLKKKGYSKIKFVEPKNAEFIIMTNRTTVKETAQNNINNITNCFDKYTGVDVRSVKRNGQLLSVIRKIN